MSTLAGTLSLHNVADVEALVRKTADDRLHSWGARLRPADYEDLISYLIGTCWELSGRYDKRKDKKPNFAAYAAHILTLRVADWYRQRFGDTRHGERPIVLSLDAPASLTASNSDGDEEGAGAGRGRMVDTLTSSEGDPALDRTPDLVGALQRRGGDDARALEALGEPPPRRAPRGARPLAAQKTKPKIPKTRRPNDAPPYCEQCYPTFRAAFVRVNNRLPEEDRLTEDAFDVKAEERAQAVKFAGTWLCPRCTTVPGSGGAVLFFDQVYPNRDARRTAARGNRKKIAKEAAKK